MLSDGCSAVFKRSSQSCFPPQPGSCQPTKSNGVAALGPWVPETNGPEVNPTFYFQPSDSHLLDLINLTRMWIVDQRWIVTHGHVTLPILYVRSFQYTSKNMGKHACSPHTKVQLKATHKFKMSQSVYTIIWRNRANKH